MDEVYNLTDDADAPEVLEAIFEKLIKWDGPDVEIDKVATVTETKKGIVETYEAALDDSYKLYVGSTEHSDYHSGFLINYVKVAVRAKTDKVGKILMVLLHEILNHNTNDKVVKHISDTLGFKFKHRLIVGGEKVKRGHYPLSVIMQHLENDHHVWVKSYDITSSPIIKQKLGLTNKLIIKQHVFNIDIWDVRRLYAKTGIYIKDGEYKNVKF